MPKPFKFTLKKVLEYRQSMEDLQAVNVQKTLHNKLEKEQQLATLTGKKGEALNTEKTIYEKNKQLNVTEIAIYKSYLNDLNTGIDKKNNEVVHSTKRYEAERDKLIAISRDRQIVENLKERKYMEYIKERRQKEVRDESEIAIRISTGSAQNKDSQ